MRYFSSLPQKNFNSTIGTFTICSFFSYYEYNSKQLNVAQYKVDNKTTLTELSNRIYNDNNSMWLFLIANNSTDPFDLLSLNPTLYQQDNVTHLTTGLNQFGNTSSNYIVPAGSVLTTYGATSGNPWDYSYVGNWNINGGFALVESSDYYGAKMIVKEQENGTTISGNTAVQENLTVLSGNGITYSTNGQKYQTKNKSNTTQDTSYIVSQGSGKIEPPSGDSIPSMGDEDVVPSGVTYSVSNYENVVLRDRYINIIPPIYVNQFRLKTFNYT